MNNLKIKCKALFWALKMCVPHSIFMIWNRILIQKSEFFTCYYNFQTVLYNEERIKIEQRNEDY